MLDNQITLSVDEQNDGVGPVNHIYDRFDGTPTKSSYIHENHTLASRKTLGFYRTFPKPSGNFKGVAKTSTKFSEDITVLGQDGSSITAPIITEFSVSLPVGATAQQAMIARQRHLALLDRDDVMVPAMEQQMV